MVCVQKLVDGSIPVSHEELEMEYQRGLKAFQIEQDQIRQEKSKKPRRKIPKPGCYPSGFSTFTDKKVACTISLSELRKDLIIMNSSTDQESIRSGYWNYPRAGTKRSGENGVDTGAKRHCRPNLKLQNFVQHYSDSKDRRLLQKVLRQSILEQPTLS